VRLLGAGAGAERRRAKPVGPAGEASCASSRALAAIRELVVTTDPLVVKMMLRDGGNSSFVKNKQQCIS
jgi:hypothetical protein